MSDESLEHVPTGVMTTFLDGERVTLAEMRDIAAMRILDHHAAVLRNDRTVDELHDLGAEALRRYSRLTGQSFEVVQAEIRAWLNDLIKRM